MRLFNSLTRTVETFIPQNKKCVKMYVCGITPYDTTHLGHAFTYVFFDTLVRYLRFKGYEVDYVQNVTDIDDDLLKKAKDEKKDWQELGDFWTKKFLSEMKALNVLPPTHYVKATNSIDKMIQIILKLIKRGFAYEKNGNLYFEVKKFKSYGSLSHYNRNQMILLSKERGGDPDDPLKKDPLDFVLWQAARPGEPSWQAPFGNGSPRSAGGAGRPGWHIECSSMAHQYLGEKIDPFDELRSSTPRSLRLEEVNGEHSRTIDIHGGGRDLIFPHHESEIAQSESFTNKKPFVKYWLHTAMVIYEGEKMSKSLGNLVMVSDLLKKHSANAIRWVLLSHHYRDPWEFHEEELNKAEKLVADIVRIIRNNKDESHGYSKTLREFESSMDNDVCTPNALMLIKNTSTQSHLSSVRLMMQMLGFYV